MSATLPSMRGEDARYRRFGVLLGAGAALLLHGALFLIPSSGEPETASPFQRGIKAKTYRHQGAAPITQPRPTPTPRAQGAAPAETAAERRAAGSSNRAENSAPSSEGTLDSGLDSGVGLSSQTNAQAGSGSGASTGLAAVGGHGGGGRGEGGLDRESAQGSGEITGTERGKAWETVLAELEQTQKGQEQSAQRGWSGTQGKAVAKQTAVESSSGGDLMDPRIRVQIVSYPPTAIDNYRAKIPYPRTKVVRRELSQGTCRVYLRVWTDGRGDIVKEQLKAPASEADRALYADFINAVRKSTQKWPFDAIEAEVHIDVLFELREAD